MKLFGENAGKYIKDFSNDFMNGFMTVLRVRWGVKAVKANTVYQEYIANKEHVHMNATRWNSLHGFVLFLQGKGLIELVDEERGLIIRYIDNSLAAKERNEAKQRKESLEKLDVKRQAEAVERQMEMAMKAQALTKDVEETELKALRPDGDVLLVPLVKKSKLASSKLRPSVFGDDEDE